MLAHDRFRWTWGVLGWMAAVAAIGAAISYAPPKSHLAVPGIAFMFFGGAFVVIAILLNKWRTGQWLVRTERERPTWFEAMMGLTGAALAASPWLAAFAHVAAIELGLSAP
jgi:hypothetical protein